MWVIWYPDVCIHKMILDKGVGNGFIKVLTVGENWEGKNLMEPVVSQLCIFNLRENECGQNIHFFHLQGN